MTYASLCSGIEGFGIAAIQIGWKPLFFCEIEDYAQQIIAKRFSATVLRKKKSLTTNIAKNISKHRLSFFSHSYGLEKQKGTLRFHEKIGTTENPVIYEDVKKTDFSPYSGKVDVLTAGFPCQPFSVAGLQKGKDDARYLWPEIIRCIREVKPRYVVAENVPGIVNLLDGLVFEQVCADLESAGYTVQPLSIGAAGVNAWHRRQRIWFIAILGDPEYDGRIASTFGGGFAAKPTIRPSKKQKKAKQSPRADYQQKLFPD